MREKSGEAPRRLKQIPMVLRGTELIVIVTLTEIVVGVKEMVRGRKSSAQVARGVGVSGSRKPYHYPEPRRWMEPPGWIGDLPPKVLGPVAAAIGCW